MEPPRSADCRFERSEVRHPDHHHAAGPQQRGNRPERSLRVLQVLGDVPEDDRVKQFAIGHELLRLGDTNVEAEPLSGLFGRAIGPFGADSDPSPPAHLVEESAGTTPDVEDSPGTPDEALDAGDAGAVGADTVRSSPKR